MNRTLLMADRLTPLSPTGEAASRARSMDATGQLVETIQLPLNHKGRRVCSDSIRRVMNVLRDCQPTNVECWGPRAIETAALVKMLSIRLPRRNRSQIQWTAVHTSSERLLSQHLGPLRHLQYSTFHRHLIRDPLALADVKTRFPGWQVDVLEWSTSESAPGRVSTSNKPQFDSAQLRESLQIPDNARLIGTVAELLPRTRIKDFIWAGDLMSCIRDDVYWLVIGDGPQQARLKRFAKHLEIGDHLRFLGWPENTRQIVSSLDVYVQPSTYDNGCAAMIHALISGVPVVSTSHSLHRRLVQHGVNGFVVERGARNEIARCVNRLINRPDIASRFSRQANTFRPELAEMLGPAA